MGLQNCWVQMVQCSSSLWGADALLGCTGPMGAHAPSRLMLRDVPTRTDETRAALEIVGDDLGEGVTLLGDNLDMEDRLGGVLGGVTRVGECRLKAGDILVGDSFVGVMRAGEDRSDPALGEWIGQSGSLGI